MRILVVSTLYPPVAVGGYEVECSAVVDHLLARHDVRVLTSSIAASPGSTAASPGSIAASAGALAGSQAPFEQPHVMRELPLLTPDRHGALKAPLAALKAVGVARRALVAAPDLVYVWNSSLLPQAALRAIADSGVPMAVRVCEHWFGRLFTGDQFLRELVPARRSPARSVWAAGCRAVNALPALRLDPLAGLPLAISWNSEAIRRMAGVPSMAHPVLERVEHSVPRYGDIYADVVRDPAPTAEIAFVGRVTPVKGLRIAIEALARLRSEHGIAARLLVVGPEDAGHGAEMRALARRLGVGGSVSWQGQRTPGQIAEVLARAHALIVPSVWDEPFPLVTIEGAFARVPLVAADVGGIGEGMPDEECALLFPRGDAPAAAAALARTLLEAGQTAARVARARDRADSFRLEPYLSAQERFVEDAVEALRARRPAGRLAVAGLPRRRR